MEKHRKNLDAIIPPTLSDAYRPTCIPYVKNFITILLRVDENSWTI